MKRGVCVSDLHCGSTYGMLPEGFVTFEGIPKLQNIGQKYLWECWLHFTTLVEDWNPDFVIVNGDDVDGMQDKQRGAELCLGNWKDQRDACIKTLKPLRAATKRAVWLFTMGTAYHTGHFSEAEEDIAEAMEASPYSGPGGGKLCHDVATLKIDDGVIIEAAHHISFASVYRSTPLEKEAQATWHDVVNNEAPLPDLQIRSHVHNYSQLEQGKQLMVTTPCWQLQNRFPRKSSVHRNIPHIGGIFIEADYEAKKRGEPACRVKRKLYKLPPLPVTEF